MWPHNNILYIYLYKLLDVAEHYHTYMKLDIHSLLEGTHYVFPSHSLRQHQIKV